MPKIYDNDDAIAVFIEGTTGPQFFNTCQASSEPGSTLVSVTDLVRDIDIVSDLPFGELVDLNDQAYGADAQATVNALNAVFSRTGPPDGTAPVITSSLTASLVEGETLNYEIVATNGVAYETDLSSVSGVVTAQGNSRKLVGGSSLAAGVYNIPIKAINYYGEDSETLVLTVSQPAFANTKSVQFDNQEWLGGNASQVGGQLGRASNGSGSSDAWTISFWFKGSTASQGQVILYFGDNDTANGGYIQLMQINSSGNKLLRLRYGSNNNNLRMQTGAGSITPGTWQHIMVTYDGGTTGSSSALMSTYYGRFKIYIDGTLQTTANSQDNYGYTGSVDADNFRIGRFVSGNWLRSNAKVDELAIWGSDQSSNVSDIYNSGSPHDLSDLASVPEHWWRMGDGDTYPNLQDSGSAANLTLVMYSMTVANIVTDVPS